MNLGVERMFDSKCCWRRRWNWTDDADDGAREPQRRNTWSAQVH